MSSHCIDSPIGQLQLVSNGSALTGLFTGAHRRFDARSTPPDELIRRAMAQLEEYFQGTRRRFDLPLAPVGTAFQRRVWGALQEIPLGATMTYSALAAQLGNSKAARAVGLANARNPISIVVPCHRVIGANGALTGYAGGLACKEWLLRFEQADLQRRLCEPPFLSNHANA